VLHLYINELETFDETTGKRVHARLLFFLATSPHLLKG